MQTVQNLFSNNTATDANGQPIEGAANWAPSAGLAALRVGTSAVSALSRYNLAQSDAANLSLEAGDEDIAARGEYVQAQQKQNIINAEYLQTIGKQRSFAAAGGIDIGSGSVQELGRQAETEADRQINTIQLNAQRDAALRRSRAVMLRAAAATTRASAPGSLLAAIGSAGLSLAQAL